MCEDPRRDLIHYRNNPCPLTLVKCSNIFSSNCYTASRWLQTVHNAHDFSQSTTSKWNLHITNRELNEVKYIKKPHRNVTIAVLLYFCPHHLGPQELLRFHILELNLDHSVFPHWVSKDKRSGHLEIKRRAFIFLMEQTVYKFHACKHQDLVYRLIIIILVS